MRSLEVAIQALYLGEVSLDLSGTEEDQAILLGIEKLGRQLEIGDLFGATLESDRRLARQRRTEEVEKGRDQLDTWFKRAVLGNQVHLDAKKADDVKWCMQNSVFADVLLCATDDADDEDINPSAPSTNGTSTPTHRTTTGPLNGIPIGPFTHSSRSPSRTRPHKPRFATLFPAHRAMLLRSEYFTAMFSSSFKEAQPSAHLPIVHVDCSPAVLVVILTYLYTEHSNFPLDVAIDVLFTADQLFIEKLKVKAAMIISTLGNGPTSVVEAENPRGVTSAEDADTDGVNIYDVIRAGWLTRMQRLEEFGARFIAYRLEKYIEEEEFRELVLESAGRIRGRQETDTVELVDDIRHYLSERFRLRFEDTGFDELVDEQSAVENTQLAESRTGDGDALAQQMQELTVDSEEGFALQQEMQPSMVVRTLDGEIAGDEFAQDAMNYQILLGKIDTLLESLKLDA